MYIRSINSARNTSLDNKKKSPAFQSKLEVADDAQKVIIGKLNTGRINPEHVIQNIQRAFEEITEKVDPDGIARLVPAESKYYPNQFLNITYKYPNGKIIKSRNPISPIDLLPDPSFNDKTPLKRALMRLISKLDDVIAKDGKGYGEANPYTSVFDELYKSQISQLMS